MSLSDADNLAVLEFTEQPASGGMKRVTVSNLTEFAAYLAALGLTSPTLVSPVISRSTEENTAVAASPNILLANESGKVLANTGAKALNVHTLPTAAAGLNYVFVVEDSDGIKINAATDDTITVGATTSVAAGYVQCTQTGAILEFFAINATEWVVRANRGGDAATVSVDS